MKKIFTLEELALFTQTEKDQTNDLFSEELVAPKKSSVDFILGFSKALSVKKSKNISTIEMMLN